MTDQGLDDYNTLTNFAEEYMKTLCVSIHRPGGLIPNPQAGVQRQPVDVQSPGRVVSMIAKKQLLLTSFAAHHLAHTSRPIDATLMTRVYITSLSPLREQEQLYVDPSS